jgi:hypothetical protein
MTPARRPLLDIRERLNGSVVIKRYPFETIFNAEEWKELCEYCAIHTNAPGPEYKFTCWKGDCKLHDDCIHSYGQEYPPCVDACAMQAAKAAREQDQKQWQKLEDYINANSPWLPGTDDRVTDARKLIAEVRSLRHQQEAEQPKEGWR